MTQWSRLQPHGMLDSRGWNFVEREDLLVPYYWHRRVLSQVPDFDESVCRNSRRSSSLPSLRIWCCEDETGRPEKREAGDKSVLARAGNVLGWWFQVTEVRLETKRRWWRANNAFMLSDWADESKRNHTQGSSGIALRGIKTWEDENERNWLQESLQMALLRC
jgi:hypothetical protein